MAKSVRRAQSQKVRNPRTNKTREFRSDFPTFKGPRYTRKSKYVVAY